MKRLALETDLLKSLFLYRKKRLLVALSGGRDSVVLLKALHQISPQLKIELGVAHVHHGMSSDPDVQNFRDRAFNFSEDFAGQLGWPFYFVRAKQLEASEASWRKFRHAELEKIRKVHNFDFIVYAHHLDDLLETRLLRLIRGTGSQGLQAMHLQKYFKLRPFLQTRTADLTNYAQDQNLKWIDDDSNRNTTYFRNWIRHEWLPQLEARKAGSVEVLARSLEHLTQDLKAQNAWPANVLHPSGGLNRKIFNELSKSGKQRVLARYLRHINCLDFTKGQIDEVIKRLNTVQKNLTFELAKFRWVINAQRILAEPLSR